MKILGIILVLLSLWSCGPQQSSAQKDQAQNDEELLQRRALYMPFNGSLYRGTLTKPSTGSVDITLSLSYSEPQTMNPGRLESTGVPTLVGTFSICLLSTPCFATDPNNINGSQALNVSSGNRSVTNNHLILYIAGSCPAGGCNGLSGSVSTSRMLDVVPQDGNNTVLEGHFSDNRIQQKVTLTRIQ